MTFAIIRIGIVLSGLALIAWLAVGIGLQLAERYGAAVAR